MCIHPHPGQAPKKKNYASSQASGRWPKLVVGNYKFKRIYIFIYIYIYIIWDNMRDTFVANIYKCNEYITFNLKKNIFLSIFLILWSSSVCSYRYKLDLHSACLGIKWGPQMCWWIIRQFHLCVFFSQVDSVSWGFYKKVCLTRK